MVQFNKPCDSRPGDERASRVNPDCVIVEAVAGAAARGPLLVGYCDALLDGNKIVVPASNSGNMGPYEMENVTLQRLDSTRQTLTPPSVTYH